ncbi:MAG TPA: ABC transporter substrate-binding protein [Saprospiraceae bacterium]|nr:ABC transporter substrate-binding protein [Saprospiraceae bacterium]HMQ82841.1 ABC transporter substrate-binding protein [Saprospiraceae bacterium]
MKQSPLILSVLCLIFVAGCKPTPKSSENELVFDMDRPLDEVVIHLDGEPDRLNPCLSVNVYSRAVFDQLFLYLLNVNPVTLEFEPALAISRPKVSPIEAGPYAGGLSYEFEIHPQAVWDDGSPVTGHDFAFTLKAVLNTKVPAVAYRPYLSYIKDVVVDPGNPKKFTVYYSQQYMLGEEVVGALLPVLPAYLFDPEGILADIPFAVMADEAQQAALDQEKLQRFADAFTGEAMNRSPGTVDGCGPYDLVSWETGQRLVLKRKDNWWGDKLANKYTQLTAYPAQLTFKPIPDPNTASIALKDGQIDVLSNLPPNLFEEIKASPFVNERYNFFTPSSLVNTFLYVNTRSPKLSDKKVRQALANAIDVQELIEAAYEGYGEPYTSPVHPSSSYYNKDLKAIAYNPEKAIALLNEAGWKDSNNNGVVDKMIDGELVEMDLEYKLTAGRELSQTIAQLIKDQARRAGFNITLTAQEFNTLNQDMKSGNYELAIGAKSISPTLWEPKQNFHSEGDNRTGWSTPESDALIDRIQVTIDEKERNRLYLELQAMLYDELPWIYLLVPTGRVIVHKRFEATTTPIFPGIAYKHLQLKPH